MQNIGVNTQLLNPEQLLKELGVVAGQAVGDLGCGGAAYFTIPTARLVGSQGKVYALDILKSALDGVLSKAKMAGLTNIETVWSDLERVGAAKVPESSLDAVLLINLLFQTRQNEAILQEAKRLLKPGGKLLVVDWKVEATPFGPDMSKRMSAQAISGIGRQTGLNLDREFEASQYHYGIIFVK